MSKNFSAENLFYWKEKVTDARNKQILEVQTDFNVYKLCSDLFKQIKKYFISIVLLYNLLHLDARHNKLSEHVVSI